jgi:hypothetical protein
MNRKIYGAANKLAAPPHKAEIKYKGIRYGHWQ